MAGVVGLLTLALFWFGVLPWRGGIAAGEIAVAVAEVKKESRPLVLRLSGDLQPASEIDVVSQLAGRLTEVKFKAGDSVTAGALVATVHSGELAERTRQTEADLASANKQLLERERQAAAADRLLARNQELYRRDLIARSDVDQAALEVATARAQLELVRAQIAQEEAMLAQARKVQQLNRILAPVSGVVTGALSAGAPVNQARAILTIAQTDSLKLLGEAPAKYGDLIKDGMVAQVVSRHAGSEKYIGKVLRQESAAKSSGSDVPLEIIVDNRARGLALGAAVEAALALPLQEEVLTIPRTALGSSGEGLFVYLFSDGRARRRPVIVDDPTAVHIVVRQGLQAGDQVIADTLGELQDGTRVRAASAGQGK